MITLHARSALSLSQVDKSREQYEEVSENLLIEFERFKLEKAEDIKQILLNYVKLQVLASACLPLSLRPLPVCLA